MYPCTTSATPSANRTARRMNQCALTLTGAVRLLRRRALTGASAWTAAWPGRS
ncbi:hypothetical protein AHiyo8_06070 [Arthrobacter sp. Hiyo8]|nr:hypothetical protein AHiyo8_06070 [Arthrobacter sp. Hiyo8]